MQRHGILLAVSVGLAFTALGCDARLFTGPDWSLATASKLGTGRDFNRGKLTGLIRGPSAGLISNNSAGLISNNSAGLISNNSAGVIGNGTAGFRLLLAEEFMRPVQGAEVTVFDENGEMISPSPVYTDDQGRYQIGDLRPSGPLVRVRAIYGNSQEARLETLVSAPHEPGEVVAPLDPSTALVSKKIKEMIRAGLVKMENVTEETVTELAAAVSSVMSDKAALSAIVFDDRRSAKIFDHMVEQSPELRTAVQTALEKTKVPQLMEKTPAGSEVSTEITTEAGREPTTAASPAPLQTPPALELFDESLKEGWFISHTWHGSAAPSFDVTAYSGATSLAWTTKVRGGFKFISSTPVETKGFAKLTFALRGSVEGQAVSVQCLNEVGAMGRPLTLESYGGVPKPGIWTKYEVPLVDLAAKDLPIVGFMLVDTTGMVQPAMYIDRIGLEQ